VSFCYALQPYESDRTSEACSVEIPSPIASLPASSPRHFQSSGCVGDPRSTPTNTECMKRPPLEVADIVRGAGPSFVERSRRWISRHHEKVLLAITTCRTAALGGHRDQCFHCGHSVISYNSCRNLHCPKCQATPATAGWRHVSASCCPPPMCTSFSLSRGTRSTCLAEQTASSAISVPIIWHTSNNRHQSLSVRDKRETSRLPTFQPLPELHS